MEALVLDLKKRYTFADYLTWADNIRRELTDGFIKKPKMKKLITLIFAATMISAATAQKVSKEEKLEALSYASSVAFSVANPALVKNAVPRLYQQAISPFLENPAYVSFVGYGFGPRIEGKVQFGKTAWVLFKESGRMYNTSLYFFPLKATNQI